MVSVINEREVGSGNCPINGPDVYRRIPDSKRPIILNSTRSRRYQALAR